MTAAFNASASNATCTKTRGHAPADRLYRTALDGASEANAARTIAFTSFLDDRSATIAVAVAIDMHYSRQASAANAIIIEQHSDI
ncbi:MAG: hypothetical protein GEV13_08555 [Rhodospirillales bacterium]|nr:hypothetical protein [Rhodospirillales bacterium]